MGAGFPQDIQSERQNVETIMIHLFIGGMSKNLLPPLLCHICIFISLHWKSLKTILKFAAAISFLPILSLTYTQTTFTENLEFARHYVKHILNISSSKNLQTGYNYYYNLYFKHERTNRTLEILSSWPMVA